MGNSHQNSNSIVASIASHEQDLLGKIDTSSQEARDIVDQARVDAQKNFQDAETKLNDDVATTRRKREAVRQKDFDTTVNAAEARLAGVRDEAAAKVDGLAKDVLAMLMPKTSGGK